MSGSLMVRWNWLRWLRLGLGVAFLIEGWRSGSGFAYAIGALFAMQGVPDQDFLAMARAAAFHQRQSDV